VADHAVSPEQESAGRARGVDTDKYLCFPLFVGGTPLGVLSISKAGEPIGEGRRRVLAAGAALLGIAVKNVQLFQQIRENSLRDGLTGCFNRMHAMEMLDTELRRARRSRLPLSVVMFDLDHFKAINDRHGHLCGDEVLITVARRMRQVLRGSDVKCRYGGEEFLVILPDTPAGGAVHVAESLRRALADIPVRWNADAVAISASFGVSTSRLGELDGPAFVSRADAALYSAKRDGRNCVRVDADSPADAPAGSAAPTPLTASSEEPLSS
jgi:diguanylate cyclase (GGDEF)-like protein